MKRCFRCREMKPHDQFSRNKRMADGRHNLCKSCDSAYHSAYYQKNKVRLDEYTRTYVREHAEAVADYKKQHARDVYMNSARKALGIKLRAGIKRRPTDNPITIEELCAMYDAQQGRCALTGVVMTRLAGRILPTSMSLDRIDPKGSYTPGNVRIICHGINAFKGVGDDEEMFGLAEALLRQNKPELFFGQATIVLKK